MKTLTLYTGGGVSISPSSGDGRTKSAYVRLVAEDGKILQNGEIAAFCIDVLAENADVWTEVDYIETEEDELTDEEALEIIFGGAT